MVELKSSEEIAKIKESGRIIAKVLKRMQLEVVPGVSTWELDKVAEEMIRAEGAVPSF